MVLSTVFVILFLQIQRDPLLHADLLHERPTDRDGSAAPQRGVQRPQAIHRTSLDGIRRLHCTDHEHHRLVWRSMAMDKLHHGRVYDGSEVLHIAR